MDQGNEIKTSKRGRLVSAVVLILIVLIAVIYYFSGLQDFWGKKEPESKPPAVVERPLTYPKFSEVVPSDASPTSPDKVITEKLTGRKESVTVYKIVAESWTYKPDRLVVKKGEQVNLHFEAIDRDYDLEIAAPIGAYVYAKKGELMIIGFGAEMVGTYEMMCQKTCPEGKEMKGELVIVK